MRLYNLATSLVLLTGVAFAAPLASAQSTGIGAEIEAIKKDVEELKLAAASTPTFAQAIQELSSKVVVLEQELARSTRATESVPEAINKIDGLEEQLHALRREVEYLRTGIANIEQPTVASSGGATYQDGMFWSTDDGRYDLTLGGYAQVRYEAQFPDDFSTLDSAGFSLRRGRFGMRGKLGGERVSYRLSMELTETGAPLRDYYMDMRYRKELRIRVGQAKVPYTRSFLVSSKRRAFFELSKTQELQRYGRDIGVWALGSLWKERIHYHLGFSNGTGANQPNDNIDVVAAFRVEGVVLGKYIEPSFGDVRGTQEPALTVGASIVHDLVRVPEFVAGIEVPNRDVDTNSVLDNVRVLSTSIDAQFRHRGLDLALEGTWRHERWGTILDHGDNADLSAAVAASNKGRRNYLGITGSASYFAIPEKLLVGGRISHGRLPLLGIGGKSLSEAPLAQRALQIDGLVQFYRDGYRRVGFMYSLLNYNEKNGPEPEGDIEHNFMVEAQLVL